MPTLTLQPSAATGQETHIIDNNPTLNYGVNVNLDTGEDKNTTQVRRLLIKFDLSSIPAAARIDSATLSLYLSFTGGTNASNGRTATVYRVKRAWTEGTGNNTASGDGATWNTYDGVNNWGTAGCGNTTTDREATGIGTCAYTTADGSGSQHDYVLTPGAGGIQDMIPGGSFTNNGFLIQMATETDDLYRHHSSDGATPSLRPKLVINYTLPAGGGLLNPAMAAPFRGAFG